jgi:hypothetical protein
MSKRARLLGVLAAITIAAAVIPAAFAPDIQAKACNPGHPCPDESPAVESPSAESPAAESPPPTPPTSPDPSSSPVTTPAATSGDPVITAAGDIADAEPSAATAATAVLVESINPTVALTLGDNQYGAGRIEQFLRGYDPTWGAFLSRTAPAPGNHEYRSSNTAEGYFQYFGQQAPADYYSYDVGSWHLISLDSNCDEIGGCDPGSAEYEWLSADLADHPAECTLAYWHHPLFSSGRTHGDTPAVEPFWDLLYDAGADVVLNGHEHNYERFAPQDPNENADPANGIVEFVVGTGGHEHGPLGSPDRNSVVGNDTAFGVLEMTLHQSSYDFEFRSIPGDTFSDSGSGTCH